MLAATGYQTNAVLVTIAAITTAVAAVVMVWTWRVRRPPRPATGPATPELGPETPAIVDLLTGGFVVEDDAVPATLVDLAARRWCTIEEVAGGHVIVRLRRASPGKGPLTPYEQRILRHLEAKAVDGIAPAEALTLGAEGATRRWWKGFVREVNAHAGELGLAVRRWDIGHLAMIWLPLLIAWLAAGVAVAAAETVEDPAAWGEPATVGLGLVGVAVLGLTEIARRISFSDARSETPAGMEAASRWLGVRQWMADNASFHDKSAASVVLWERQLSYATAMGLAPEVQRQLPFEADHDRHAWSRATGNWRRVHIRYAAFTPSWGERPWVVAFSALVRGGLAGVAAWFGLRLARDEFDTSALPEPWPDRVPLVGLAVAVAALAIVAWQLYRLVLGLSDLFARVEVEGELVRKRRFLSGHRLPDPLEAVIWSGNDSHGRRRDSSREERRHLAVDDGSDDSIVAYRVDPTRYGEVREGARVRLRVSPRLGWVAEAVELEPPPDIEHAGPVDERAGEMLAMLSGRLGTVFAAAGASAAQNPQLAASLDQHGGLLREQLERARRELAAAEQRGALEGDGAALAGMIGGIEQMLGALPPEVGRDGAGPPATGSADGAGAGNPGPGV
ncbi:MAG: DUF2207 family protein [Acidimicrobiales bacterium]